MVETDRTHLGEGDSGRIGRRAALTLIAPYDFSLTVPLESTIKVNQRVTRRLRVLSI